MLEYEVGLDEKEREYEKKIENFAKDTLKDIENKSKMLGIAINQIAGGMSIRNKHRVKY